MSKELEALKSIKGTIISSSRGDWGFEYRYISDIESIKKDFDIIEEALKRNERMAVLRKNGNIYCPDCETLLDEDTKQTYCYVCGRNLDWGKENDK